MTHLRPSEVPSLRMVVTLVSSQAGTQGHRKEALGLARDGRTVRGGLKPL